MRTVAVSSQVQAFVWTCVFTSWGKYPSSGIAGSCGKHTLHFVKKKNKNGQTVLLEWLYMIFAYNKGRKEKKYTLLFRKKKKINPSKKGLQGGKAVWN